MWTRPGNWHAVSEGGKQLSERTAATQSGRPRRRSLVPRLSDVRIQSKLGLILLVPILAVVALAGIELATAGQTLVDARQVDSTVRLSNKAGRLIQALQDERLAAAQVLMASPNSARTDLTNNFKKQNTRTDQAVRTYRAQRSELKNPPGDMTGQLSVISNQLDSLTKEVRLEVLSPDEADATVASVTFRYQVLISELLDMRQSVVKYTASRVLSDELSANAALSQAKEFAAQEQLALLRVISDGQGFDSTSFETFLGTLTGQQSAYDSFNRTATDSQQRLLQEDVNGPHVQDSTALETDARTDGLGNSLSISETAWNRAMEQRITAIRGVEQKLDATAAAHAQAEVASVVRKVIIESAAGLLVLLIAIILALLVARAMARSLRRLREGALRVAYEGLPQAVTQLRETDTIGGRSPEEIAGEVRDPVQVRGRDEIGQVSEAFNVVHREAVRVAAEQAVLRSSVSTMFVNLARRSQLLVDRLIGHLDRLEQGEEDPDRLAQLFQLDHLATRMRRNDENLLVLAGADSTRARREAAALGDVLRAAQSEVEQYTRIEFGVVDRDVEVEATAVNDVVHLVAELLDNATSFSAPDSAVVVDARRVGDRAIVQIEDRGIGMSSDVLAEVNERLAAPPLVDVAVSRMMGLVVVGRLASRLGIRIELRAAHDRGTVADVILPGSILVSVDRTGRQSIGLPTQEPPLALEPVAERQFTPDPMPGLPYQPAGRESLADAANAHGYDNGSSSLPRRPAPRDAEPEEQSVRRSLFDPPQRSAPAEPDPEAGTPSWDAATGSPQGTPERSDRRTVADQLLPRRSVPVDPGEAVTTQWEMPPGGIPAAGPSDTGADSGPIELPRRATEETGSRSGFSSEAGSRAGTDTGERADTAGWPAARSGAEVSDMTVETPKVGSAASGWTSRTHSVGADGSRQSGTGRQEEDVRAPGRLDSARSEPTTGSSSGRNEIIPRNVDDTMELPIFREVESAWFRTSPSRPRTGSSTAASTAASSAASTAEHRPTVSGLSRRASSTRSSDEVSRSAAERPGTEWSDTERTGSYRSGQQPGQQQSGSQWPGAERPGGDRPSATGRPDDGSSRQFSEPEQSSGRSERPAARAAEVPSAGRPDIDPWQSAADKGWQAASAAAPSDGPAETTGSGLPKRRPMAQLVPGGVEDVGEPVQVRERSPEAVRGLLSAYHRGVQRGRASGTPRSTSTSGHRSTDSGAGEEQEA